MNLFAINQILSCDVIFIPLFTEIPSSYGAIWKRLSYGLSKERVNSCTLATKHLHDLSTIYESTLHFQQKFDYITKPILGIPVNGCFHYYTDSMQSIIRKALGIQSRKEIIDIANLNKTILTLTIAWCYQHKGGRISLRICRCTNNNNLKNLSQVFQCWPSRTTVTESWHCAGSSVLVGSGMGYSGTGVD